MEGLPDPNDHESCPSFTLFSALPLANSHTPLNFIIQAVCFSRKHESEWIISNEVSPFISLIPSKRPSWNACSKCDWSMYHQSQALRAHHTTAQSTERLLVGQGIVTLFRKPGDQKDGGLLSQRIIFVELEFGFLLHEKISVASLQIWTYSSCWVPELSHQRIHIVKKVRDLPQPLSLGSMAPLCSYLLSFG